METEDQKQDRRMRRTVLIRLGITAGVALMAGIVRLVNYLNT